MCCQPKRRLIESLEKFGEISLEREYFLKFSAGRVEQSHLLFIIHTSKLHIHDFGPKTMEKIRGKNYITMMQYEHHNLHHIHLSVLPSAFPEPSPSVQFRGKRALKGRERREQILMWGRGVEYRIVREIKWEKYRENWR